jgi:acyl-CoA hydrolase
VILSALEPVAAPLVSRYGACMSELAAKLASDSVTETTQLLLPGDANSLGAAFGGSVMGWIDICAAVCAQRHCRQTVVTASMDDLHFHAPITIGMAVTLKARVIAAFTSSMEIGVTVHSENPRTGERKLTTSALLTFVALDEQGKKLKVPALLATTDEERAAAADATDRRADRLSRKDRGARWLALVMQQAQEAEADRLHNA